MTESECEFWQRRCAELKATVDALSVRLAQAEQERDEAGGADWVPTTNIDATLAEMEKRGVGWVESFRAWLGSAGAYYTAEAYRVALGDAELAKQRAERAEVRLREYEEALQKIADNRDAAVLNMDGKEIEAKRLYEANEEQPCPTT